MTAKGGHQRMMQLVGLAFAALWALTFVVPHVAARAGIIDAFEYRLVDLRHTLIGPRPANPDVVIVAIDDETLAADTTGTTGTRQRLAQLIAAIAQSGAHALALDVLLADPGEPTADATLAEALGTLPSVIAAAASFSADPTEPAALIWPQPVFRDAAQAGLVNLSNDDAGTPRYAPLLIEVESVLHPSLVLLAALAVTGEQATFGQTQLTLGDRQIPLDLGFNMPLRFIGAAGSVKTLSAKSLLDGPMQDELKGKVVVLGYTASATGDRFATPFDDSTPGVEIIATAISQLIGGPTLRRDRQVRTWDAAHAVGLTLLGFFTIMALPLSRGIPVALALICLSMISVTVLFAQGLWLSAALPLAAAIPPMIFAGVLRYTRERRQAKRAEQSVVSLRRFQSPALAAKIESNPEYLATPIEQDLVILFVDLTGFTGLSQRLGADGTRNLLRLFHALTAQTVEAQSGSVFNYMGDGALAVFGLDAPTTSRAADNALTAAFNLARALSEQRLAELPDEHLGCRIGLHKGAATLSRLGADSHQQVTVTGDSVNLASRLMEVAKTEQAVIVASSDFSDALTSGAKRETARLTEVPIRGRTGNVLVLAWTQDVIANTG